MQAHNPGRRSLELSATPLPLSGVFIVVDDASVRESIALALGTEDWRVESLASAEEFLARPRTLTPTCLILDVSVSQLDWFALQEIMNDHTETPLIFVAAQRDSRMTARAMKAGAVDLLTKPLNDSATLSAVRTALDRSRHALAQLAAIRVLRDRYGSLSRREREVLELVISGLLNKQIGAELGISEITVKAHRGKMMRKMAANSLAELVSMTTRLGLSVVATNRPVRQWHWLPFHEEAQSAH